MLGLTRTDAARATRRYGESDVGRCQREQESRAAQSGTAGRCTPSALRIRTRQYDLAEALIEAGELTRAHCLERGRVRRRGNRGRVVGPLAPAVMRMNIAMQSQQADARQNR